MNEQSCGSLWLRERGALIDKSHLERLPARPEVRRVGDLVYVGAARNQKTKTAENRPDAIDSSLSGLARLTQHENLREGDVTEALRLTSTAHPLFSVAQSVRSAVLFSLSCVDNAPDAGPVENIDSCVSFTLSVSATAAFDSMAFLRVTAARFMMNALSTTKRPAAEAFGVTALPGDALLQISAIYALR